LHQCQIRPHHRFTRKTAFGGRLRRTQALAGIDAALKRRDDGDPGKAELDAALKRIGELTMENELLRAKMEKPGPLGRRRSRR
jgi:hypothetical protein